jgi:hypothetical protein
MLAEAGIGKDIAIYPHQRRFGESSRVAAALPAE